MLTINRNNWVRRWFTNQLIGMASKRRKPSRLAIVEALEDRTLLTAYVVNTTSDDASGGVGDTDGFVSLREAIAAANSDAMFGDAAAGTGADTITFDPGVFGTAQTITLDDTQLLISSDIAITGPGSDLLTINGNNASRHFQVNGGAIVEISELKLEDGNGTADGSGANEGGAIDNNGNLTLRNMWITDNTAQYGGAIDSFSGFAVLTVINSTISNNMATFNGGGIENNGTLNVTNSTISGNMATSNGGGIEAAGGTVTITNSTITGNHADLQVGGNQGGGIGQFGGSVTLNNTIVAGNVRGLVTTPTPNDIHVNSGSLTGSNNLIGDAGTAGGLVDGTDGNIVGNSGAGTRDINTILNTTLTNHFGAMLHQISFTSPAYNSGSNALSVDETDTRLQFDQRGGPFVRVAQGTVDIGAYEIGVLQVNTLLDETDNPDTLSLREAIAIANFDPGFDNIFSFAPAGPGTINLTQGQLVITEDLQITGPGADQLTIDAQGNSRVFHISGGAEVAISGMTMTGGSSSSSSGGAIYSAGESLTLNGVRITDNNSSGFGGGVISFADLTITGSTIDDNTAGIAGGGLTHDVGELLIVNSTISSNTANGSGAGVNVGSSTTSATIVSSTITLNRSEADGGTAFPGAITTFGGAPVVMQNTIVAGNITGTGSNPYDLHQDGGTFDAANSFNNLIGNAGTSWGFNDGTNGNIVGVGGTGTRDIATILNTLLQDNGGPTLTHGLIAGSAALNNGADNRATEDGQIGGTALTGDQRGFSRFIGTVDIGAFEGTVAAPDDHGNDFHNATPLAISVPQAGLIDYFGDQDWFVLPVISGLEYTFTATQVSLDGELFLYESDGTTLIDSGDGIGQSAPDIITWTATFTGDAYLLMGHWNNNGTGDYELSAEVTVDDVAGWNTTTGRWYFGENTNGTIDQQIGPNWNAALGWDIHSGDFNGDGVQDYAGRTDNGAWYVVDGVTKTSSYWGKWGTDVSQGWNNPAVQGIVDVGDFNGDGLDDIFGKNYQGKFYVSFSSGAGFFSPTLMGSVAATGYVAHRLGDFNGDGMTDVVSFHNNGSRWVSESDGTSFALDYHGSVSTQASAGWQNFLVGDFNGDGYDDVLQQAANANGQWWKGSSNQAENGSFITSYVNRWNPNGFSEYKIGDFNGDGMDDMVGRTIDSNQLWVNRSLPNGRMNAEFWNGWGFSGDYSTVVGDFNGDGLDDLAGVRHSDGRWLLQTAIPKPGGGHKFNGSIFGNWTNFTGTNQAFTGINDGEDEEEPIFA